MACPKPVIAAIDGPAVGMGAEFTSQCDIRIASSRARFAWNFSHRGLVPDTGAGSWLLPRLIGVSQALWLLYSGEFISAREAHELKYVATVVEPDELILYRFNGRVVCRRRHIQLLQGSTQAAYMLFIVDHLTSHYGRNLIHPICK